MTGALGADEAIEAQERDILKVDRKSDKQKAEGSRQDNMFNKEYYKIIFQFFYLIYILKNKSLFFEM
jgi:hypothetical protein